jgi:hypothetical protein
MHRGWRMDMPWMVMAVRVVVVALIVHRNVII